MMGNQHLKKVIENKKKYSTEPKFVMKVASVTLSGESFKKVPVIIFHQLQCSSSTLP